MTASPTTASGHPTIRRVPGEAGIWVLILGDMSAFGAFFGTFLYYRAQDTAVFVESQRLLSQHFGAINTLLLLISSWFVVIALNAARTGRLQITRRLLACAWLCGLAFVAVKYFEWGDKLRAGITPATNDFFMYYFIFTGIHLLHLVIGLGVLGFLVALAQRPQLTARDHMNLESGACFWHMVDLLWIVLFPLLYLIK